VIHLAFAHDLSSHDALTKAIAQDSAALATLGDALIDSGPPGHRLRFCDREGGRPCHRRDRWGAGAAGDQFVLDEMGYLPLTQSGGQRLFHLVSKLYERTSVIITINLAFAHRSEQQTAIYGRPY
jgi:hypothetical protein